MLTKDDPVSHPSPGPRPPLTRRSLVGRAVVAGSAAALLAGLSATAQPPAAPTPVPAPVRTAPVVPLAAAEPTAPAAVRTAAVQKALGKLGAKYRYGAAGPDAFDCSGLVTWAFTGSGKTLPRTSKALSRVGTPVAKSAMQPGDLVFFYSGPSHVGIYVGNGKIVHASNPKYPVKIAEVRSMPFNSARRV